MLYLLLTATEYVQTGSHPDWVRCRMEDVHGRVWTYFEKVPVVTSHGFDKTTPLPHPAYAAVVVLKTYRDAQGREVATVDTNKIWGIESEDGASVFEVFSTQLVEE